MRTHEAPVPGQDQPTALAHLDDVLELARREEPAWPTQHAELLASGALLNDGTEAEEGKEEEPNPDDDHSDDNPNPDDAGDAESFTDFDLDSLPQEARAAAEAAQKRMQADYTRKTQESSRISQEAKQYQAIVEGLEDPERRPEILRILAPDDERLAPGDEEWFDDVELDESAALKERIDQLESHLVERDQVLESRQIAEAEDQEIAEQIESWENENEHQFSKEEIAFLYLYADEFRGEDGNPDVKAAIDLLEGIVATRQQGWIESKKAPRRMRPGKSASQQVDLSTETQEERVKRMAEAAEAARGAGE